MKYILRLLVVLMMGSACAQSNLPPCDPSSIFHNCFGTHTFSNGDKYVGEYKDNRENGQGTFTGVNGDKYVGEWKDGKRNGQGTLTFARGEKYVGEFKDGVRQGEGTLYAAHGLIISQGRWRFNRFDPSQPVQQAIAPNQEKFVNTNSHATPTQQASTSPACQGDLKSSWHNCFGTSKYPNGGIVACEIKNGKCDGKGTALFPNGSKYVGDFKDGVFNGQGTYSHANGDVYVGDYKDDKRNGQGTYTFSDGVKYVGGWKDGNRNGQGILYASNGSVHRQGEWSEGKFVGSKFEQEMTERLKMINVKRQSSKDDPISQALNYVSGFAEDSSGTTFFAKSDNNSCGYTLLQSGQLSMLTEELFRSDAGLSAFAGMLGMNTGARNLNLNQGDPRSLQVFQQTLVIDNGTDGYGRSGPNRYQNKNVYKSKIEGVGEFQCDIGVCNPDRIRRAWNMIYSKCNGTKKAF